MKRTAVWSLTPSVGILVIAALTLFANSGCQERPATTPSAESAAPLAQSADASKLLEEMVAAYQSARSYEDAGELHVTAEAAGGQSEQSPAIPFSVAFERPNKLRVHSMQASILANGKQVYASAESLEDQVLVLPCPETLNTELLSSDKLLTSAMQGQIGAALPQLTLLLDKDPLKTLADGGKRTLLADENVGDESCQRVSVKGPQGTSVFWISRETHLLRKFEFPSDAFKQKFSLTACSIWAQFDGAQTDRQIASEAFKMEIPAGTKLVKRFLPPPPEAPSPLLAQTPGNFVFVDLQGQPVERDSLKDKVVVLDMWATWCGWCFEGFPNLEKVYQQFKDNDNVVILAVNKDEPTITDQAVRASFEKAHLNIPIVRDQQGHTDQMFQAQSLPTMVLLGKDGTVQDYHRGYDPELAQTLPKKLERLLAGESLAKDELEKYEQERKEYDQQLADALVDSSPADESGVAQQERDVK